MFHFEYYGNKVKLISLGYAGVNCTILYEEGIFTVPFNTLKIVGGK
jgi:hypothetical protein